MVRGHEVVIIAKAPFRVSLFGGGSDFPEHFIPNGGAVVGGTIDRYCFVSVRTRPQSFGTKFRVRYSQVDEGSNAAEITHPAVSHLLKHLGIDYPLDLNHSSDLPSRSGIGSSSAFLAAAYAALTPEALEKLSPYEISALLSNIERGPLSETCGMQDSIFSVFGGVNLIEFADTGFVVTRSRASRAYMQHLASHCFLVYLGNERLSSTRQMGLVQGMADSEPELNELARMARETFGEINDEILEPRDLGKRLAHGWNLKKKTSPAATNPAVDELHNLLGRIGAWGGKVLGAGGGGFYLAIASDSTRRKFEDAYPSTVTCSFNWEFDGLTIRRV